MTLVKLGTFLLLFAFFCISEGQLLRPLVLFVMVASKSSDHLSIMFKMPTPNKEPKTFSEAPCLLAHIH